MSIEFVPAVCPKCGGELRVPSNLDIFKCMYCGMEIIPQDKSKIKVEPTIDVKKCFELAEMARMAGNAEEVYKYATIALEQEPNNRRALLYKGLDWKRACLCYNFPRAFYYTAPWKHRGNIYV